MKAIVKLASDNFMPVAVCPVADDKIDEVWIEANKLNDMLTKNMGGEREYYILVAEIQSVDTLLDNLKS